VSREESCLALVLDTVAYRDRDLIVKFFTPSGGTESAMAYSARKSRTRFPSGIDRLTLVELEWTRKGERMAVCKSATTREVYWGIKSDIEKSSVASLLSELLMRAHVEKQEACALFDFSCAFLAWLDEAKASGAGAAVALSCFILRRLGFLPGALSCPACGDELCGERFALDTASGSLSCGRHAGHRTASLSLSRPEVEALNTLLAWPGSCSSPPPLVPIPRALLVRFSPVIEDVFGPRLRTLSFLLDVLAVE
jgi:DNA repair protein RecO